MSNPRVLLVLAIDEISKLAFVNQVIFGLNSTLLVSIMIGFGMGGDLFDSFCFFSGFKL